MRYFTYDAAEGMAIFVLYEDGTEKCIYSEHQQIDAVWHDGVFPADEGVSSLLTLLADKENAITVVEVTEDEALLEMI